MNAHAATLDLIVNAVAAPHDLDPYLNLLALDGTMALVGIPAERHPSPGVAGLIAFRRSLAGSLVGSLAETQESLNFSADHNVLAQVETIPSTRSEELMNAWQGAM